ncbi:MAG: hypothetical protein F4X72_01700 [Dehalococcoidia bacterium]|nr:hypothetical protein [Dehalococcoidia bacterium]
MTTSESLGGGHTGRFYIFYDDERELLWARAEGNDGTWRRVAASDSLEDLFSRCRKAGLKHFEGADVNAIDLFYRWLTYDVPVLQYLSSQWGEKGKPFGFRIPKQENLG